MGELRRASRLGRCRDRIRPTRPREKDERGAVVAFVVLLLSVLMTIAAFAVDVGMHRVTRADLQALADMVALDLAREIRGQRSQADLAPEGDFSNAGSAVRKSAARNPAVFGQDLVIDVDWGSYDDGTWNTAAEPPSAVRVIASADTDYAVTDGVGDSSRTAYAVASNSACYRLGTFVAAVRSGDSTVLEPLNYLLDVNLGLVSYQALAGAQVTLAELSSTAAIGSPTQLLTGTVTYSDLILAMIEALSNKPGSDAAAISALQAIHAAAGPVGAIALGDVLHVSPTDQAALGVALNVLDIVGSARLSTGDHFIEVDNLQAGVAGVGSQFTGGLTLISAAQLACGEPNSPESVAKNAQLEGDLGVTFVNLPSLSIPNLATFQTAKGTGSLHVSLADGQGQLVSPPEVHCGDGTANDPHTFGVSVQTQLASYALSAELDVTGEVKVKVLKDLGLTGLLTNLLGLLLPDKVSVEVHVRLDVATSAPGGTSIANLSLPPNDEIPVSTGTSVYLDPGYVVPTITEVKIKGTSVPVGAVVALTDPIVNELLNSNNSFFDKTLVPFIDAINEDYVGPVARMVGLRFGGADVYAVGAVCGQPALWG